MLHAVAAYAICGRQQQKKLSWNISRLYLCSMQLLCNPLLCSLLYFLTNLSYSTLLSDSTMLIFFNLKYITPLTNKEKATVSRKAYRKLGGSIFRPNITESISTVSTIKRCRIFPITNPASAPIKVSRIFSLYTLRGNLSVVESQNLQGCKLSLTLCDVNTVQIIKVLRMQAFPPKRSGL